MRLAQPGGEASGLAALLRAEHTQVTLEALRQRGMALHRAGQLAQAERIYAEVLRQDPGDWRAHLSLGGALLALRRQGEALAEFDAALALQPDCVEAHHGRGMTLLQLMRSEAALASFERALALEPQSAELCNSRGNALRRLKRLPEALASYERALALQPDLAAAHNNRGLVLQAAGTPREAAVSYERALALQPQFAEAYNNLGTVQCELGEPAAAIASYGRALALQPGMRGVHGNLGNALRDLERPAEALAQFEQALLEAPESAVSHCNLGNALLDLQRLAAAIGSYDRAIALDAHYAQAYFNKSVCLLLSGDFAHGLPLYEWRKQLAHALAPPLAAPAWDGTQELAGRSLLVYADQALGDTLQFCRYAHLAQQRGAQVILRAQPQLAELLATLGTGVRVVAPGEEPQHCDYQCALLSLPLALRTTLQTIPHAVPYLKADPRRVSEWRERLGPAGFKVGIAWQGSRNRIDVGRSVPLAMFAPLAGIPGLRLISLQKGEGVEQLQREAGAMPLELPGEAFDTGPQAFLDSAALMQHLDLVITCDTALAHLAGALGRAAWVALKYVPDWRWLLDRTDNPWYPSMQLFRQSRSGDWEGVFAAIRTELAKLVRARAAAAP
ncbi:MAG: tetratricopeptide repeat protein [Steroidobacteraceae bacterium]